MGTLGPKYLIYWYLDPLGTMDSRARALYGIHVFVPWAYQKHRPKLTWHQPWPTDRPASMTKGNPHCVGRVGVVIRSYRVDREIDGGRGQRVMRAHS